MNTKRPRRRPSRPLVLTPDVFFAVEELAGRDGYVDARTWIVARLKEIIRARADELPKGAA